jgi:replicative DNA helicase
MARELRDIAARRELITVSEQIAIAVREAGPGASMTNLISEAIAALQCIIESAADADTRRDAAESATALVDRARAIMAGERFDDGVSTGLPDLDLATGGFQPGTLWIVAGRPRMGKTILATGFARKVAGRAGNNQDNQPSVGAQIFSLEVTEDQIVARLLADLAYSSRHPVTFGKVMLGMLDEGGLRAIEGARDRLAEMPLALDVAGSLSVAEIAARVRSEKARMARRNVRLGVVFIDYLKFVRATDRYRGNRVYEVGEITKELKALAKAEGLCVVLLAQVNRAVEGRDRKDRSPGLADLRESGDLEADADIVLFIDRESVRVKQSPEYKAGDPDALNRFLELEHQADLIVAKTRVGSERTVNVWFNAGASTFSSHNRGGANV